MTKYLIKGELTEIIGRVIAAHIEMNVEEVNGEAIDALVTDKNFLKHLFYEGKLVIDNFCIDECGPFGRIEIEEIKDE